MNVDILDAGTGESVDSCVGPGTYGECPRAGEDGVVPCEGFVLQVRAGEAAASGFRFLVTRPGPACPLRAVLSV